MSTHIDSFAPLVNGKAVDLSSLPLLAAEALASGIGEGIGKGKRVIAYFGTNYEGIAGGRGIGLVAVLADDAANGLVAARTLPVEGGFPSIATAFPQVQLFEREIAEQYGLVPEGHPWLKPVRYHHSWTESDAWGRDRHAPIPPAVGDFYRVEGDEVHEVAVGPVHAGIIEPGHFRFQCHGETVFHLEIALGYQHRGLEASLAGKPAGLPGNRSMRLAETIAGDTSIAHATAHAQVHEALAGARSSPRADTLRAIALELERLANHTGDLGAIAGDIGYLPTSSYCGRIRGDFLNLTAILCGNRFGRGYVASGGVDHDLDEAERGALLSRLAAAEKDVTVAVSLLWDSSSVMARLEDTGRLTREVAVELGLVGVAARASGLARDARADNPSGIWRFAHVPVATAESGDVLARAHVRWLEIQRSIAFIRERLEGMPGGKARNPVGAPAASRLVVTLVEGWRGEVCHVALTGDEGSFLRYKVVDPSFHNWSGLARALRGQEISDFPLCNKSFNLSYCGHDL